MSSGDCNSHDWFREAAFGMFIHYGVSSVIGRGEWVLHQENMSRKKYEAYAPKFKAEKYDPDFWACLAKEAGMRYMVLTTKHHDGYCLFRTKTTKFNSTEVGPKSDLIGRYVKACRKHGLKVGLYFSLPDWSWPVWYKGPDRCPAEWRGLVEYLHEQVRELCTQYGKIDLLWYDNILSQSGKRLLTAKDYASRKLNKMVRELQPGIMINDRSLLPEDFSTSEQNLKAPKDKKRLWESCLTMNKHWGYFPADNYWKPAGEHILNLTACAATGGNYLLNIGPKPDGEVPAASVRILREIGGWMKRNGNAIYGAERGNGLSTGTAGVFAFKGSKLNLFVHWWPGKELALPDMKNVPVKSVKIAATGKAVNFRREGARLILENLPTKAPDSPVSVIEIV
jgi:alpha-L-fucosidase